MHSLLASGAASVVLVLLIACGTLVGGTPCMEGSPCLVLGEISTFLAAFWILGFCSPATRVLFVWLVVVLDWWSSGLAGVGFLMPWRSVAIVLFVWATLGVRTSFVLPIATLFRAWSIVVVPR